MSSTVKDAPKKVEVKDAKLASVSAGGASILIALQVGSRALTFLVNQILLRYLSPELLGISTHLDVYSISVLFFARESLRVAIQRQPDDADESSKSSEKKEKSPPKGHVDARTPAGKTQTIVNLSYISVYLGVIFAVAFAWAYMRYAYNPIVLSVPYFALSLKIYGLAAIWELLSEPIFVVVQQKSRYKVRARAESTATLLRCLATCGSAVWAAKEGLDIGVLPFALGQAAYAASLSGVYYLSTWGLNEKGSFSFLPASIHSSDASYIFSYFSRPFLILGGSIFTQSIVKHILTQGDTLLIAALASTTVQGSYALASNYGGLLARLLLQPIEESSRNYFGKLLAFKESRPSKEVVESARDSLAAILRAYVLISIFVVVVGPSLAPILLRIVAGSRWEASGAGEVLSTYSYYIPLLAINGITEAFVSSVATKAEINRQSTWMLAFSAAFAASAYYFLAIKDMGAQGLVWANVINMFCRVIWSFAYIGRYFRRNGTRFQKVKLRPEPMVIAASIGAIALFMNLAQIHFDGSDKDLLKGGAAAAVLAITIAIAEQEYIYERYLAFYA